MKSLTFFLLGVITGAVGAGAIVIYWRRMQALEELTRVERQRLQNLPVVPPMPPLPPDPGKPQRGSRERVRDIARERAVASNTNTPSNVN